MLRQVAAAALSLFATASCASGDPGARVENAVISLPAVPGGPGAAYFTIHYSMGIKRLVSISSAAFTRSELHGTMAMDHNMTGMAPLKPDDLVIRFEAPLVFAPGGKHAMLFGVDPALRPGAKVQLTFQMDSGPLLTAEADLVGPGQVDAAH